MEKLGTSRRIHPLVAGAAVSVMLVSLTGIAAMTGLIPSSYGTGSSAQQAAKIEEPVPVTTQSSAHPEEKTAAADIPSTAQPSSTKPARRPAPSRSVQTASAAKASVCQSCGRVESVHAIQQAAQPSGLGMVAGAVLGGVLGNQVGGGNGRKLATVAGAVGGGYAGNEVEKRTRASTTYEVRVRLETGDLQTFTYAQPPHWKAGDRVRVADGQLTVRS